MAKIVISKQADERRDMYSVNVWHVKANGRKIGRVEREIRPNMRKGGKTFHAIMDEPLFRYQRVGQAPTLERRKAFDTLALIRSYLSKMPVIDTLVA